MRFCGWSILDPARGRRQRIEDVEVALAAALRHDAHFLEEVRVDLAANDVAIRGEEDANELAEP